MKCRQQRHGLSRDHEREFLASLIPSQWNWALFTNKMLIHKLWLSFQLYTKLNTVGMTFWKKMVHSLDAVWVNTIFVPSSPYPWWQNTGCHRKWHGPSKSTKNIAFSHAVAVHILHLLLQGSSISNSDVHCKTCFNVQLCWFSVTGSVFLEHHTSWTQLHAAGSFWRS